MRHLLKVSRLLFSCVALMITLAILSNNANTVSAQKQKPLTPPRMQAALSPLAPFPAYRGWLVLDFVNAFAQVVPQTEVDVPGSLTIEGWILTPGFDNSLTRSVIYNGDTYHLNFTSTPPPNTVFCVKYFVGNTSYAPSGSPNCGSTNQFISGWHYFAYVFDAQDPTHDKTFWDGVIVGGTGSTSPLSSSPSYLVLSFAQGMDELRISDVPRYAANFQPPTGPFTCDDHTRGLWHFDEIAGSTTFHDACGPVDNKMVGYNGAHTEGVTPSFVFLPLLNR